MIKSLLFAVFVKFNSEPPRGVRNLIVVDNSKVNRGFAGGVNLGIKQALQKGAEAVILVNPDITISRPQLDALFETRGDIVAPVLTFKRNGKVVNDYGGRVNFFLGRTTHIESTGYPLSAIRYPPDYVSGACMLIRQPVFEKIGFFDERFFLYFEDADFCLRAKRAGFSVVCNPNILVAHQIREHRFSQDKLKIGYLLGSNWQFINKWVPWYFWPMAYFYWVLLWLKTR